MSPKAARRPRRSRRARPAKAAPPPADAPARPPRRLAPRAGELARGAGARGRDRPGIDGVEFDVRLSRDGVPVLLHDETLERVQGRDEAVADLDGGRAARRGDPVARRGAGGAAAQGRLPRRRAQGRRPRRRDGRRPARRPRQGAEARRRSRRSTRPRWRRWPRRCPSWPRWLNADATSAARRSSTATRLGCRAVAVLWGAITPRRSRRARRGRPRGRRVDGHPAADGRAARRARRDRVLRRGGGVRWLAAGRRRTLGARARGGRRPGDDPAGAGRPRRLAGRSPATRSRGRRPRGPDALGQLPDGAVRRPHPRRPVHVPRRRAPLRAGDAAARDPRRRVRPAVADRRRRDTLSIDLDERWPFRGRVVQRFALTEASMTFELTLEADEPMPATIGWHPWFRRVLEPGDPPVELEFAADEMLVRDAEGMPSGRVASPPPPPPWDDAFTGVHADPVLTWPGRAAPRASRRAARGGSCTRSPSTRSASSRRAGRPTPSTGRPRSSSPARPWRTRCAGPGSASASRGTGGQQVRRQQVAQLSRRPRRRPVRRRRPARSRPCASGSRARPTSSPSSSEKSGSWPTRHGRSALVRASGGSRRRPRRRAAPASRSSTTTRTPSASATISAVWLARSRGDVMNRSGASSRCASSRPRRSAWRMPFSDSGRSSSSPDQRVASPAWAWRRRWRAIIRPDHGGDQASSTGRRSAANRSAIGRNWWIRWPSSVNTEPERRQALVLGALDLGRVRVAPVQRLVDAREHRAGAARVVAHGDHVVEPLAQVVVDRLRCAARPSAARPPRARGSSAG